MGNMGNPTITRLGKTQLWYKNYFSDAQYSRIFKKTKTFETLINKYFNYGLFCHNNIFINNFWYKNNFKREKTTPNNQPNHKSIYFRKFYYAHKTLTIEHSYFMRLKTPEFFTLKIFILRYNNWFITSLQWFKPLKSKNLNSNTKLKNKKTLHKNLVVFSNKKCIKTKSRLHLLLVLFTLKSQNLFKNSRYGF